MHIFRKSQSFSSFFPSHLIICLFKENAEFKGCLFAERWAWTLALQQFVSFISNLSFIFSPTDKMKLINQCPEF